MYIFTKGRSQKWCHISFAHFSELLCFVLDAFISCFDWNLNYILMLATSMALNATTTIDCEQRSLLESNWFLFVSHLLFSISINPHVIYQFPFSMTLWNFNFRFDKSWSLSVYNSNCSFCHFLAMIISKINKSSHSCAVFVVARVTHTRTAFSMMLCTINLWQSLPHTFQYLRNFFINSQRQKTNYFQKWNITILCGHINKLAVIKCKTHLIEYKKWNILTKNSSKSESKSWCFKANAFCHNCYLNWTNFFTYVCIAYIFNMDFYLICTKIEVRVISNILK